MLTAWLQQGATTYSVVLLRSTEGRPSPNYRIYSNAFQGGRVSGDGAPFNYSNSKVTRANVHGLACNQMPSMFAYAPTNACMLSVISHVSSSSITYV